MAEENKIVATIGLSGFPEGMAASQKLLMMGKAAIEGGKRFLVISNTFVKKGHLNTNLKKMGHVEGIIYLTSSPYVFSPKSRLKKIKGKIVGALNEFLLINKLINIKRLEAVFIYSSSFPYIFFWTIYLKLRMCKSFLIYFELRSQIKQRNSLRLRFNDYAIDHYSFRLVDGVITISEYLINHIKKYDPQRPIINIPPIVDFDEYKNESTIGIPKEEYFLFCGNISYLEIIEFILQSFKAISTNHSNYLLYLVVNGSRKKFLRLENLIKELGIESKVKIYSGLSKKELIQKYINAFALLIPLRNNLQDTARFPHKIAEYCASSRPIISCKIGEVGKYFDENSAFLSNNYHIDEYSQEMIKAIINPNDRDERAKRAYEIGLKNFDYRSYSVPLSQFIENPGKFKKTI